MDTVRYELWQSTVCYLNYGAPWFLMDSYWRWNLKGLCDRDPLLHIHVHVTERILWTYKGIRSPLPRLCFSGRSEIQDGSPGLWLTETFSTSSLKPLNGMQRNLARSKISSSSSKVVFFGPIGKSRWQPWPLISRDIFDFFSETAEWNSTILDR